MLDSIGPVAKYAIHCIVKKKYQSRKGQGHSPQGLFPQGDVSGNNPQGPFSRVYYMPKTLYYTFTLHTSKITYNDTLGP